MGHHFISYSSVDGLDFALKLTDALASGPPSFEVWLDKRRLRPGEDWDEQIVEAIRTCDSLIFIMTTDSVEDESVCKNEWVRALKYKKPIVPLKLHPDAQLPFSLGSRQHVDFTASYETALARLRIHLSWLASPEGKLQTLKDRLADAKRDLRRATDDQTPRVQKEIDELTAQIAERQKVVDNPQAAIERTQKSIETRIEGERQPEKPVSGVSRTKFINQPPCAAPSYFQDRHVETGLVAGFLQDEARRLITVVGRAGIGKSAMVCRLLKSLEAGKIPDDRGDMTVDGIVYLSALGSRKLTFPTLFADLCRFLPDDTAARLDTLYRDPQVSITAKTEALLAAFPQGRTVLLLDNFEDVVDPATQTITDSGMDEALRALLNGPQHGVKAIITTRVAPRELMLLQPGRQGRVDLDSGLGRDDAITVLRQMDADARVGLHNAPEDLLAKAWERTSGFPRALEALYAILSTDRDSSLEEVLGDAARLLPDNVVQVLVGEAFSRLDSAAQQVMEALAIYQRPVTATAVDYLLSPYIPGVNSAPVLGRLVTMHFARKEGGRVYYLHPVDRAYAQSRIPEGDEDDRFAEEAPPFSRFALLHRGADYHRQVRLPRGEWKRIDDLAPQLAEFELRCAGGDFDTAAGVLLEFDFDYLFTWGHYQLMVEMHERLHGHLGDPTFEQNSTGNLGSAYFSMGRTQEAIASYEEALNSAREVQNRSGEGACLGNLGLCYSDLGQTERAIDLHEQALAIAREIGYRQGEANHLGNLGNCYYSLDQTERAIDFYNQALAICREIGHRVGEASDLGNLGNCYHDIGQTERAINYYDQALAINREISCRNGEASDLGNLGLCYADLGQSERAIDLNEQGLAINLASGYRYGENIKLINIAGAFLDLNNPSRAKRESARAAQIADEIGNVQAQNGSRHILALAQLMSDELAQARAVALEARSYNYPPNNHSVTALLGVIALLSGEPAQARKEFSLALAQASELMARDGRNYRALDTKGLALAGLVLCGEENRIPEAIAAYRAARAINRDAGVVRRVLRLFDKLAETDVRGLLTEVRTAAVGSG